MSMGLTHLEATKLLLQERYENYLGSALRAKAVTAYSEGAPLSGRANSAALIAEDVVRRTAKAEADFFEAQAQAISRALEELDELG